MDRVSKLVCKYLRVCTCAGWFLRHERCASIADIVYPVPPPAPVVSGLGIGIGID